MNHRQIRLLAVLLSLLLLVFAVAVPAFAVEGDEGNGTIVFPTDPAPPTPTPTPTPTPEPTPTPTPEPTPTPTPVPVEQPNETNGSWDSTTPAPQGGGVINNATPKPSASAKPGTTATTPPIQNPSMERPKVNLNTTPTMAPTGPNYVTFAQLNLKNNSISVTLFYLGIACALLGAAGIAVMIVLLVHRRRKPADSREDIFVEIEEAENRYGGISAEPELIVSPPAHKPVVYDPMFTESGRFEPMDTGRPSVGQLEPMEIAPPVEARSAQNAPIMPVAADIYTDEFPLEDIKETAEPPEPPPEPDDEEEEIFTPPPVRPLASRLRHRQGQPRPEEPPPEPEQKMEEPVQLEPAQLEPAPPTEQPQKAEAEPKREESKAAAQKVEVERKPAQLEPARPEAATREMPPVKPSPKKSESEPEAATQEIPMQTPKKGRAKAEPSAEQRTMEWPAVKPERAKRKPKADPDQLSLLGEPEEQAADKQPEKKPAKRRDAAEEEQIKFF